MSKDMFDCQYNFTSKCIDPNNKDCDNCPLKSCMNCDNSWSSNVCSQCKFSDERN